MKNVQRWFRHVDRLPEILTAARTFDPFLPITLEYLDARSINYPMDARLPNGLRVRLTEREDVKILWHIFVRRCYGVSGKESVILDLGANVGFFALYAATNAPGARILQRRTVSVHIPASDQPLGMEQPDRSRYRVEMCNRRQ